MVRRSQKGRDWYQGIITSKENVLIRYTRKLTGNLESAKDIVQESLMKLWDQKLEVIRPKVTPWLYTVCRNAAIDLMRRENKMVEYQEDSLSFESYPEEELMKHEVFRQISALDSKYQEVIVLKFQEGMSYKEISAITGKSESNVGLLIHEGMKQLRQSLTDKEGANHE